jgi:hypothetical protein
MLFWLNHLNITILYKFNFYVIALFFQYFFSILLRLTIIKFKDNDIYSYTSYLIIKVYGKSCLENNKTYFDIII